MYSLSLFLNFAHIYLDLKVSVWTVMFYNLLLLLLLLFWKRNRTSKYFSAFGVRYSFCLLLLFSITRGWRHNSFFCLNFYYNQNLDGGVRLFNLFCLFKLYFHFSRVTISFSKPNVLSWEGNYAAVVIFNFFTNIFFLNWARVSRTCDDFYKQTIFVLKILFFLLF